MTQPMTGVAHYTPDNGVTWIPILAGLPGPPGPPGADGVGAPYVHIQSMLDVLWTVNHNMGKHPEVTCEDSAGSIIFGSVHYVDNNTLTVEFAYAITGRANCT